MTNVSTMTPVERKKFFRRRYYYHSKLKGLKGFNPRKRTFSMLDISEVPATQRKYVVKLMAEFGYLFQKQLF